MKAGSGPEPGARGHQWRGGHPAGVTDQALSGQAMTAILRRGARGRQGGRGADEGLATPPGDGKDLTLGARATAANPIRYAYGKAVSQAALTLVKPRAVTVPSLCAECHASAPQPLRARAAARISSSPGNFPMSAMRAAASTCAQRTTPCRSMRKWPASCVPCAAAICSSTSVS